MPAASSPSPHPATGGGAERPARIDCQAALRPTRLKHATLRSAAPRRCAVLSQATWTCLHGLREFAQNRWLKKLQRAARTMHRRLTSSGSVALGCGLLAASFGTIDGLDWLSGRGRLVGWSQNLATAPLAALCFVLAGIGIASAASRRRLIARVLAALLVVLVLCNLGLHALNAEGLPAEWLVGDARSRHAVMSWATSLCFALAAISLLCADAEKGVLSTVATVAASAGLVIIAVSLVGILFDVRSIYSVTFFVGHALSSGLAFLLCFVGLLLLEPKRGWVSILLDTGAGSIAARRLLPLMICVVVGVCYAGYRMIAQGLLPLALVVSIIAALTALLLGASVLWAGRRLNEREAEIARVTTELEIYARDRDLLLREVNHRVKNNLAQIHSMLGLQARRIADPAARQALGDMRGRIEALSTLHRILLAKNNPSTLLADDYLTELCRKIEEAFDAEGRGIRIRVEADRIPLQLDFAISTGMLVNELASNAVKHAFSAAQGGTVDVRFASTDALSCELSVADDGCGLKRPRQGEASPADEHPEADGGLGTKIINALVAQLRGSMEVSHGIGTHYLIRMPVGR
ncbi:sensor histidine kinase [Jiella sonneratiae]|uniref:histidine kinase n=1 Tax=Jiella sonneratiae TaxID=2816856 RepID=A0ABS3IXH0_9HYPH|nr:sensor histidine kinase [Jiella sonneratiae]MBO0902114.1 sensor histidine kinase [Jiella sonneratiae]